MILFTLFISDLYGQYRERLRAVMENEGREVTVTMIRKGEVVYVSLTEFADLLGLKYFYNPQNKKVVLRVGSQEIKVTSRNPFITVGSAVYQLALETIDDDEGRIYVPFALFWEAMGEHFPADLEFEQDQRILRILRVKVNITGIEVEEKRNGHLIRLVTTKKFQTSEISASINRDRLYVTVYGGFIDSARIASDRPMGIIKKIEPFQNEESAYISFLLGESVVDQQVFVDEGEILVSLRSEGSDNVVTLDHTNDNREIWLIDKIVIDPGHGGRDPGGIGPTGLEEKEVNLDIAKRVKTLLEKNLNVEVLLTREDDRFIELKERTQFANRHKAKLFISIHANINNSRRIQGFSTYLLGTEKSKAASEVAEKENSVIQLEESVEVYRAYQDGRHILNRIAHNTYLKESQDLARMINEHMGRKTKLNKFGNGIYQANFYVLVGAAMPKVLIETAFLSNKYEERLLRTRSFRQKVAEAIYESIKDFKVKSEKGIGS